MNDLVDFALKEKFAKGDYIRVKSNKNYYKNFNGRIGIIYIIPDNLYDYYHIRFMDLSKSKIKTLALNDFEMELISKDEAMVELL